MMHSRNLLLALLPPLFWGVGFTLTKPASAHFQPLFMMLLVYAVIAIIMLVAHREMPKTPWLKLTVIAAFSVTIQGALMFSALAYVEATTANLVLQTQVPIAILLGWLLLGEALDGRGRLELDLAPRATALGAEGLAAFHTALIADYLNLPEAEADYRKALLSNRVSPRLIQAYGNFLERAGRIDDATALYQKFLSENAVKPVAQDSLARIAAKKKPEPFIRGAEDGVAESLFGMAASLSDRQSADISILYLRMALYLRPDLALADLLLADRFETLGKYEDAITVYRKIDKSSPYYRMAATQAAIDEGRLDRKSAAIANLRSLTQAYPDQAENWIALGDAYRNQNLLV